MQFFFRSCPKPSELALHSFTSTHPILLSPARLLYAFSSRREVAFFSRCCRERMSVVDVGANVGLYTGLAMHLTGVNGTVVAIETHTESQRFLRLAIEANATTKTPVHVCDCAASDREGTASLFVIHIIRVTTGYIDPTRLHPRNPPPNDPKVESSIRAP
jgi:hypothetical protein